MGDKNPYKLIVTFDDPDLGKVMIFQKGNWKFDLKHYSMYYSLNQSQKRHKVFDRTPLTSTKNRPCKSMICGAFLLSYTFSWIIFLYCLVILLFSYHSVFNSPIIIVRGRAVTSLDIRKRSAPE